MGAKREVGKASGDVRVHAALSSGPRELRGPNSFIFSLHNILRLRNLVLSNRATPSPTTPPRLAAGTCARATPGTRATPRI